MNTPPGTREHFPWIDSLRFLAAAEVVVVHTREFNWSDWPDTAHSPGLSVFFFLTRLGYDAIVIFFVLSGWLVGGKVIERVRAGTFDPAAYAADRLARVYVPLVPALLLTAAVVRGYDLPFNPVHYLACLVGMQSAYVDTPYMNIPLWTLGYELWFYVLAGCAGTAVTRRISPAGRCAAAAGAALALGMLLHRREWVYLLCWLLGAAGYAWRDQLPGRRRWLPPGLAAILAGTLAGQMTDAGGLPFLPLTVARLLLAVGTVCLVTGLARMHPATRTGQRLERLGTTLAAFSYTLYLTHCPTLWFLALPAAKMPPVLDGPALGRAGAWMTTCVAVALVMYALFESRTPAVRRWLRTRLGGRPAVNHRPSGLPVPAAR